MYLAPFTDALLFTVTMGKARFWEQTSFHGVDLSPLYPDAKAEMFGKFCLTASKAVYWIYEGLFHVLICILL
jgi:hypothetical protein